MAHPFGGRNVAEVVQSRPHQKMKEKKQMEVIREFKIADGNKFTATFPDGEKEVLIMKGNAQLWELLKWDIDNDPSAKACADVIVRNLIGVGFADLTPLCPEGMTATVEIIPVGGWEAELAKGAEIFGEVVK